MARPLIAIPGRWSQNASALRSRAVVSARALVAGVYAAGGEPLTMFPADPDEVPQRLGGFGGVLLPGGGDLAGKWSGQPEHPTLYDVDLEQDAFDLAVARWALDTGTPLLAVCRGLQVVNVLLGGSLVQDMGEQGGEVAHHRHRVHQVRPDPGSLIEEIVGPEVDVSCYHHQCLATLGSSLQVTARSEEDVIEAVERPDSPGWFLGVQWHPEDTWEHEPRQLAVFEALVAASSGKRG